MRKPESVLIAILCAAAVFCVPTSAQKMNGRPMVVVISLDAFGAESLRDPHLPAPTLHTLMKAGAYARSMQPINPTVTWPNHTSMVTGVSAAKHHVLVNGLIVGQRGGAEPTIDTNATKQQLVAVPTVYDAAHAAGLTTAEVDWVAIRDARTIDWSFAERPDSKSTITQDLLRDGTLTRDDVEHFGKPSQAWRDRMYTAAAVDILTKHHPNLLLLHLLALDSIEHETGFGNDSGRNTIAFLDDRVREIVNAVRAAGDIDRTTFVIVSDHGQESVHHQIHADVLLRERGLQGAGAKKTAAGETFCVPDGGFALLYQQHATAESTRALQGAFRGATGVRAALTPAEAAKDSWPTPEQSGQAPDLLLYADNGYEFADEDAQTLVTDMPERGAHGYPNSEPLMQAIFIASGREIRAAEEIAPIENLDLAPTIAKLLGVALPTAEKKPLRAILQ